VPLGKAASELVKHAAKVGNLNSDHCLFGFPHPSGANGHRKSQFAKKRAELSDTVDAWSKTLES
ncbi:MAG: hypothetical protein P1V97_26365, partial [Planctomycetota bacterium]|nr:hypothetical protein [Planctomycetota bacterium]